MPRFVVLLRGINVGKAKRVAMADLRDLLAAAGYTDVRTHLNSGNAVVTGADEPPSTHAGRIEAAITGRTGVVSRCVVLTAEQVRAVVAAYPFADLADNGSRMMAHFLGDAPDPALLDAALALDPDNSRSGPGVLYQWCGDGVLAAPPITAGLGVTVTARNWNTVTKLAEYL